VYVSECFKGGVSFFVRSVELTTTIIMMGGEAERMDDGCGGPSPLIESDQGMNVWMER